MDSFKCYTTIYDQIIQKIQKNKPNVQSIVEQNDFRKQLFNDQTYNIGQNNNRPLDSPFISPKHINPQKKKVSLANYGKLSEFKIRKTNDIFQDKKKQKLVYFED